MTSLLNAPSGTDPSTADLLETESLAKLRGQIFGYWITRAIAVVAELRIADSLANGPRSVPELATESGMLERPLYRVLRALAGEGIFFENADGQFELTPTAELLRSDHPRSLRDWAIFVSDLGYRSSFEMLHTLRTGEPAFPRHFGMPLFEYVSANPASAEGLFRAMSSISAARIAGVLDAYDFSGIKWLVDVGGAHGAMLAAIARQYPTVRGTCFDLPAAEQGAITTFAKSGVGERCNFIGGDLFEDVPAGADMYVLSAVLHDWDDDRCLRILRNCRRRIDHAGKLLVIDIVLSDEKNVADTYRNCLDLATMTQVGGMERTESEFRSLLARGGFSLVEVVAMNAPQCLLVASPA